MPIPPIHRHKYAFHFTHLDNLASVIQYGLLATVTKDLLGIDHRDIASASIQERRSTMEVPVGAGGTVHDYVPFYFCSKNPMLLSVLNTKNVDQQHILFLCLGIDILNREGTVFTDASANTKVPPNFFDDPADLDKLDWAAINSLKWGSKSDEERHHRMAELLVHNHVDIKDIGHIVAWNGSTKKSVIETFEQKDVEPPEVH
jgi:hypothetical protein